MAINEWTQLSLWCFVKRKRLKSVGWDGDDRPKISPAMSALTEKWNMRLE
jgi:hypothetical protein